MKRGDRLYALVDLLRARHPGALSTTALAAEFGVSARTIERDLAGLQAAGVPIHGRPGPGGGYVIEREFSLPPLQFTAREAYAVLTGLATMATSPFAGDAAAARRKTISALPGGPAVARAMEVADTYFLAEEPESGPVGGWVDPAVEAALATGLSERRVVVLDYRDGHGALTHRAVEPLALLFIHGFWVVAGWCRLREGIRGFRVNQVLRAELTDESVLDRGQAMEQDLARWAFDAAAIRGGDPTRASAGRPPGR